MKRFLWAGSCCAALLALSVSAFAQAVPKDIQAFYTRCTRAMEKRDGAALAKTMAPNMVSVDPKGHVQRAAEVKMQMTQVLAMMSDVHVKFTIISATVKGNRATVVNDAVLSGNIRNPQNGMSAKMKSVQRCKDVLVKSGGVWLMEKTTTLKDTSTINGKPAPTQ